jgi:hypothetical protein
MTLMLTVATCSLVTLVGIAVVNLRLRHTRERYGYQPSSRGSSAGDSGYVSDTGGWSLSSWFGDFGSSGHDGCVSSDGGGNDCGGGGADGGGGGH